MRTLTLFLILALGGGLAQNLTVLTHNSFNISEETIAAFTAQTGIRVNFLQAGDAGETVNRAILTRERPLGDLLFGIDNNLIARARAADILESYISPLLSEVDTAFVFDSEGLVTPIDVGFVNFNLDRAFFEDAGLEFPTDITDLTTETYEGLTVVMNPASSSPGLAFMLATIVRFGFEGDYTWLDFWAALRDNDLLVSDGWSDAYYNAFSLYGGDRPIVLSYATSPAAEVFFAEGELETPPTANLFCEACVYAQIEGVAILRGTQNREAAERFIDFMLSETFQTDIPLNMFVYPVNRNSMLPQVFIDFGEIPAPEEVASIPSDEIEANLTTWLDQWTRVVLQGADVR